jgi:Flp pilus assembly protein TadD
VYTFGIGEELLLGGVFIVATLSFRGLYDGPPLLMSIALGVLTAFGVLKLWQLGRRPTVRIQNLVLKLGGKVQSRGWIFALLTVGWLAFTTHSAFAQWHRAWGQHYLEHTEATKVEVLGGVQRTYSEDHDRVAAESFDHFVKADRWGLVDVVDVKLGLAWGYLLQGDSQAAEREVRAAMAVAPDNASLRTELRDVLTSRARSLVQAERYSEAVEQFRAVVELGEDSGEVRFNLGGALRRLERYDEAIAELEIARDLAPDDYDTRVELGLAYMAVGENGRAITELEHAIELNPASPESQLHLPGLIRQLRGTD